MNARMIPATAQVLVSVAAAGGQCIPAWRPVPGAPPNHEIFALKAWDPDGPGPAAPVLVATGNLLQAGAAQLLGAGIWDGTQWHSMAGGFVGGNGRTIALYDLDGPGPLLPRPLVGGGFTHAGGVEANGVAHWDGFQWHALGTGLSGGLQVAWTVFQYEQDVFVTGPFTHAGGVSLDGIARWDGAAWHALADERASLANEFFVHNGELHAGGYFRDLTPVFQVAGVLKYVNNAWVNVGNPPVRDTVYCLAAFRGQLVAGGFFDEPNGAGRRISILQGDTWTPMGQGMNGPVRALCVFDPDGEGPLPELLIAGGIFTFAGGQAATGIAAWDGKSWSPLGEGTNGPVYALEVYNGQLAVGGNFTTAGGQPSPYFALWGCPQQPYCYANCDQSTTPPVLNVADFVCFMQRFAEAGAYANCDGSTPLPALNINDFVCFQQRFAAGCP